MTKFAAVFPGQGSQAVGMLSDLAQEFDIVEKTYAQASQVLGYDLWKLVQEGPIEDLNQTQRTQPALLTASVAIWRVWESQGNSAPVVMAGHSLGEYSALVCAGVIEFTDAVKLVEQRGLFMQEAVPAGVGAMSAIIGLADDAVEKACQDAAQDQVCSAVNYNSPGQVVIAGNKEAVARANALCKEAGAKRALLLPVSVPSHCALMQPAADKLAQMLQFMSFNTPKIDVINNVDVTKATQPDEIKNALVRQLYCPVRWTESVNLMADEGVEQLLEMGPGKVLTGLTRRINKALKCVAVNTAAAVK